jgi:DNA (cytosine-5)-methyltransferase 1
MISILDEIGYNVVPVEVLKAIHYKVPQKRTVDFGRYSKRY